jgi:hypothetical protein
MEVKCGLKVTTFIFRSVKVRPEVNIITIKIQEKLNTRCSIYNATLTTTPERFHAQKDETSDYIELLQPYPVTFKSEQV